MGSGNVPGTPELRPMGIGDILDTTFRLYRQRFLTFLLIALVVYVPFGLFMGLLQAMLPTPQPFVVRRPPPANAPDFPARQGNRQPYPEINPACRFYGPAGAIGLRYGVRIGAGSAVQCGLIENISASYLGENLAGGHVLRPCCAPTGPTAVDAASGGPRDWIGLPSMCIVPGIYFSFGSW